MALSVVQGVYPPSSGTGTGSGYVNNGASGTQTFGSSTTTGNLIVVVGIFYASSTAANTLSVTDNKGNTYTRAAEVAAANQRAAVFYRANASGGASHQVSVSGTGGEYGTFAIMEISGADTSSPLDSGATTTRTGAYSDPATLTTPTLAQANEIVVGSLSEFQNTPSGWTAPSSPWVTIWNRNDETNDTQGVASYQVVSSTSAVSWSPSSGATGAAIAQVLVAFKEAAGGGGGAKSAALPRRALRTFTRRF